MSSSVPVTLEMLKTLARHGTWTFVSMDCVMREISQQTLASDVLLILKALLFVFRRHASLGKRLLLQHEKCITNDGRKRGFRPLGKQTVQLPNARSGTF